MRWNRSSQPGRSLEQETDHEDSKPSSVITRPRRPAWNKGQLADPKPPLQPGHVWPIRAKLQLKRHTRDLALFNLAIDSKLRGLRPRRALCREDNRPERGALPPSVRTGRAGRLRSST